MWLALMLKICLLTDAWIVMVMCYQITVLKIVVKDILKEMAEFVYQW